MATSHSLHGRVSADWTV